MRTIVCAVVVLAAAGAARADVYGYIDEAGVTHLATTRLDANYTLFLKTDEASPPATAVPSDALMKSRLFQRLVDHPNVRRYEPLIRQAALRHRLDPQLVKAVVAVESGFEPSAVSPKGAVGLMQVLPATGERYGVRADRKKTVDAKLADPVLNLEIGTRYLADLHRMFPTVPLALAAYNAGENTVVRYRNQVPPYPETQAYVKLVDQFHAYYAPPRVATDPAARIRVTMPAARRNLPDPSVPLRLPAPAIDATADESRTIPPAADFASSRAGSE